MIRGAGGGRGRGRSRIGRVDLRKEEQATSRRPLTDECYLKICGYALKCSNGESCPRAHNSDELELWQATLLETVRDYDSKKSKLRLCKDIDKVCERGLRCSHAHSQKELDSWNEQLECRSSSDKLLEMCRNSKDCNYGDDCRYAHNSKELQTWTKEHQTNYLNSPKSKPDFCTFTVAPPPCRFGVNCPYAHTKKEREELVKALVDYDRATPRPVPRKGKLLPYTLCKNDGIARKNVEGKCIYGAHCPHAHSEEELEEWERQRKEFSEGLDDISHLSAAPSCSFLLGRLEESTAEPNSPVDLAEGHTSSLLQDPFLRSLEDYQHHFGHQLSHAFNTFITVAKENLQDKLGGYITHDRTRIDISTHEGQESASMYDIQYQLGFMQKNAVALSKYLRMEESELVEVAQDILEVRNSLAHGLHHRDCYKEKAELTGKFFKRGILFAEKMKTTLQSEVFDTHFSRLLRMERNISEFFQYQGQMKASMGEFQKMDHQQRVKGAKEMLYQLIQLVDETSAEECSDVLEFALVSLAPRLTRLPCKADLENELAGL